MNLVLLNLLTTGLSVAADDLIFIGAHRLCPETGRVGDRLHTYVRPQRQPWSVLREFIGKPELGEEDFTDLPDAAMALRELVRFAGEDLLVAHRGANDAGPVLRETCTRLGLPTRRVRLLDSADLARRLFGAEAKVTLRELNRRLCLPGWQTPASPVVALDRQGLMLHRLWRLLDPEPGSCPVPHGHTLLPKLEGAS